MVSYNNYQVVSPFEAYLGTSLWFSKNISRKNLLNVLIFFIIAIITFSKNLMGAVAEDTFTFS